MRHRRKKRRMGRAADQRKAALRALATNLLRETLHLQMQEQLLQK